MPERTFGRMVRAQRTKLGLSQAKLGELVGRSPTTIRSWERDQSQPKDSDVITALAAVLGIPESTVYEKTGQEMPVVEDSPTVEQALATLDPEAVEPEAVESEDQGGEPLDPPVVDAESFEEEQLPPIGIDAPLVHTEQPAYAAPPEPYYITTAIPPAHEPSYMEDRSQRQLYRVRHLATIVILVSLGIALLWALTQSWEALGEWWDQFFGDLRL